MGDPDNISSPYLQALEPVPDEEVLSALEDGLYTPKPSADPDVRQNGGIAGLGLGLSGHSWEYWRMNSPGLCDIAEKAHLD